MKGIDVGKYKWFKSILFNNKKLIFLNLSVNIIISLIVVYMPKFIKNYINSESTENLIVENLLKFSFLFMLFSSLVFLLRILSDYIKFKFSWKISEKIRQDLFLKLCNYEDEFYNNIGLGAIEEHFIGDINNIQNFLSNIVISMLINLFTIVFVIFTILSESYLFGFIFMIYLILSLVINYIIQSKNNYILEEERIVDTDITANINEVVEGRKEISVMKGTEFFLNNLKKKLDNSFYIKKRSTKFIYGIWTISIFMINFFNVLCLFIGGILLFNNYISIGSVYLIYFYSNLMKNPIETMQYHLNSILITKQSFIRIDKLFNYTNKVIDGEKILSGDTIDIKVKDLTFKYENAEDYALRNINFSIKSGSKVGIVGFSGAGKSTLVKILTKRIAIPFDTVYINGMDINDISLDSIRNKFAIFSLDNSIYSNCTLRDNLRLFNKEIKDKEIIDKIRKFKFLSGNKMLSDLNSEKLNKILNYKDLSVGEVQLICLLRLIFLDKGLIIFDEYTSTLSEDIEKNYFDILGNINKNSILMLITHNVDRLEKCNNIIVLENGKITEKGSPKDLYRNGKVFKNLFEKEWKNVQI